MVEKIKILLIKKNMNVSDLAKLLNVTPQNLYNKFKRENFSIREMEQIAEALDVKFDYGFILEDGTKV